METTEINMNSMDVFMRGKIADLPTAEVVISKRYLDENNEPVKFKLQAISTKRIEDIRKDCTVVKRIKGQRIEIFNRDDFSCRVAIETTKYPDFMKPELLKMHNCVDPIDLVKTVLNLSGEYTDWTNACFTLNGYDVDIKEDVEKAKN